MFILLLICKLLLVEWRKLFVMLFWEVCMLILIEGCNSCGGNLLLVCVFGFEVECFKWFILFWIILWWYFVGNLWLLDVVVLVGFDGWGWVGGILLVCKIGGIIFNLGMFWLIWDWWRFLVLGV